MQKTENENILTFHQGNNYRAFDYFGAHFNSEKDGVVFRTWAKNAESVSIVGDFNGWDADKNPMKRVDNGGIYELFIKGLKQFDKYMFAVTYNKKTVLKADPYAFYSEKPSKKASLIYDLDGFTWTDDKYIKDKKPPYRLPMNIYEVNLASWKRHENGDYYTYNELAEELVDYVVDLGFTHVELMPVTEYPFDGSWGYQVTGYYSICSRFGTPKDFMRLVDTFHSKGIGVIVDWVPAHFPKDEHGLFEFDGTCCYESSYKDRKERNSWGTRVFDWGKNEVKSFLISSAVFLFSKFHVDGLRVDAVASMLYLDYDNGRGDWVQNQNGGNYNLEAIEFLRQLNSAVFKSFSNVLMIAEESTAFPMITKPIEVGGLGFNYKWNMGWMNDVLSYMQCDPYFRSYNHNKMNFSMCYAFSENFILPISHDEVVHLKKSLYSKMFGDTASKFANLRAFIAYMYAHPGKKLLFMGSEFAQVHEWEYEKGLDFYHSKDKNHQEFNDFVKEINKIYKNNSPLYEIEDSWDGFKWISPDEKDNNIYSFTRTDLKGNKIVFIANYSGNVYKKYRLGVEEGEYEVLLNTDDKRFGGSGLFKDKIYKTVKKPAHNVEYSICFDLQPFSSVYFRKI